MNGLFLAVTLLLKLNPAAGATSYEVMAGSVSGSHTVVSTVSSWATKPDGSIELSVPNWDETITKFVVVRGKNSFGPGNKSNEVVVGRPTTAPTILDASGQ